MFASVFLLSPPFSTLTYSLPPVFPPEFWQIGQRVVAPLTGNLRTAVIAEVFETSSLPARVKCKNIVWPLEVASIIASDVLALIDDLARRLGILPGFIFGHVLPPGLRKAKISLNVEQDGAKLSFSLKQIAALNAADYAILAKKLLAGEAILSRPGLDASDMEIYSAAIDPPWPLRPAAKKQAEILDYLYEQGHASRRKLTINLGPQILAPLRKLVEKNLVRMELVDPENFGAPELTPPPEQSFALNASQRKAVEDIEMALASGIPQNRLLYGVTGSGKTAVYLAVARKCIDLKKSLLLLAPEVALAHKLCKDVRANLSDTLHFLYHGYQTPIYRENIYRQLATLKAPVIVVGTRSALFLPIPDLGCIILDEEHDGSYKQDEVFAYNARELAWFRMQRASGLLILGSATPDIRTFYAAQTNILPVLRLPKRAAGGELPPVELISTGQQNGMQVCEEDSTILAPACEQALIETMARGEQAVILLNRRGYAPLIFCLGCEETIHCPHCQIGMAFHKGIGRLVCHYCGFSIPWPGACPKCGNSHYMAIGEGTERVAERLEALAGRPILRLDRDSARRAGRIEEILAAFANGESPFLVGTQMLSKGHHFPNVTLAVIADGDIGLNLPDYRAAERTFQLLVQAAGRAGRGVKPGRALIQTRNPEHYCWRHIVNYDYESFYEEELALRQKYRYPPFARLGLIRISFPSQDAEAMQMMRMLGAELQKKARALQVVLLGPAPAPIAMQAGRKRMHCLIKAKNWEPMRELWFYAQKINKNKDIRIFLDLDPVNMM